MTLLEIEDLHASYGPADVLHGVGFTVAEGEVVALMGRNGMGKTTTIRAICRMMPSQGGLRFAGRDLHGLPSHRAARLGLGLVPEGRRCFAPLTVTENLIAAARPGHWDRARVEALFPRLAERREQRAGTLSGGEQQMLAIGRALMTNPRLLILDEATEGLAPLVRAEIWSAIDVLTREAGMAILIVDKSLAELGRIADRAVILTRGRDVWQGALADLDADLAALHLGV
ncbi:ABC transporter ATP-binding protein [Palleronia sp. LCG004]|uniref:ABC transporter ATP-binding protein n=1 Tax=Palleronia sp. LCG004 TaxID=3079304 RepID=UPI002943915F|nr:ABC transporter ATP-binding protein [Palleronia sp. LCG004]WOI56393.1 ABC transporter ATP-binding protein [Palleronia sp. LCG004]